MPQAFAEEREFWIGHLIKSDPYYWSEYGLGPNILKIMDYSLEPYFVPGVTDENSSVDEIINAYKSSNNSAAIAKKLELERQADSARYI